MLPANAAIKKKSSEKKPEKDNAASPTELVPWPLQIPGTGCTDYFLLTATIRKEVRWYLLPAGLAG